MKRRIGTSIALVLVILLLAEVGVRAVGDRLPDPLRWHSWEAQRKVEQMDAFRRFGLRASYAFIGTSMMNVGVDPAQLKKDLHSKETPYNAALSLGIPRTMDTWTTRVVFRRLRPHVVVVGLTSFDLQGNELGGLRESANESFRRSPAAHELFGTQTFVERMNDRLQRWSALYRERWILRSPTLIGQLLRYHHIPTDADQIGPLGVATRRRNDTYHLDAATVKNRRLVLSGYRIGTKDPDALHDIVEYAKNHDSRVVFVNMPVTKDFIRLHPHGREDYARFFRWLKRFARNEHTQLIDAHRIRDTALFADDIHLNGAGTKVFTALMARELR